MSLQPKTRKYRLSFRNKIDKYKKEPLLLHSAKSDKNFYCDAIKITSFKVETPLIKLASGGPISLLDSLKASHELVTNVWPERVSKITSVLLEQPICFKQHADWAKKHAPSIDQAMVGGFPLEKQSFLKTLELPIRAGKLSSKNESLRHPSLMVSNSSFGTTLSSASVDKVRFGSYGIFFSSFGTISTKFIETIRLIIAKKLKKTGRFWIRVTPDTPVTARSAETRMGRGKGAISHYEAKIRPGQIFLEFSGVQEKNVRQIYSELAKKTAIPIKLV